MGQGPTKNHASKKLRGRTADGPPRLPTFGLRSRMTVSGAATPPGQGSQACFA